MNIAAVGRLLDVNPKLIRAWIAQAERRTQSHARIAKLNADQQRIRELERELAIAREERDTLKKPPRTLRNSRSKVRNDRQAKIPTCGASALQTTQCSDEWLFDAQPWQNTFASSIRGSAFNRLH